MGSREKGCPYRGPGLPKLSLSPFTERWVAQPWSHAAWGAKPPVGPQPLPSPVALGTGAGTRAGAGEGREGRGAMARGGGRGLSRRKGSRAACPHLLFSNLCFPLVQ